MLFLCKMWCENEVVEIVGGGVVVSVVVKYGDCGWFWVWLIYC